MQNQTKEGFWTIENEIKHGGFVAKKRQFTAQGFLVEKKLEDGDYLFFLDWEVAAKNRLSDHIKEKIAISPGAVDNDRWDIEKTVTGIVNSAVKMWQNSDQDYGSFVETVERDVCTAFGKRAFLWEKSWDAVSD